MIQKATLKKFNGKFDNLSPSRSPYAPIFKFIRRTLNLAISYSINHSITAQHYKLYRPIFENMIGALSDDQLAAHEASFQYIFHYFNPHVLSDGINYNISQFGIGRGPLSLRKKLGNASAILGTIMAALPLAAFATVPDMMLDAFIDTRDPINLQIVETGHSLLLINGIAQIGDSLRNIYSGGLSGFKDTLVPTLIISASILGINLPLGYVLGFPVNLTGKWCHDCKRSWNGLQCDNNCWVMV